MRYSKRLNRNKRLNLSTPNNLFVKLFAHNRRQKLRDIDNFLIFLQILSICTVQPRFFGFNIDGSQWLNQKNWLYLILVSLISLFGSKILMAQVVKYSTLWNSAISVKHGIIEKTYQRLPHLMFYSHEIHSVPRLYTFLNNWYNCLLIYSSYMSKIIGEKI